MEDIERRGAFVGFGNTEPGTKADIFGPRGTNSTCESDGGDSDGQGTPEGGKGVREAPPFRPAQRTFRGCLGVKRSVS